MSETLSAAELAKLKEICEASLAASPAKPQPHCWDQLTLMWLKSSDGQPYREFLAALDPSTALRLIAAAALAEQADAELAELRGQRLEGSERRDRDIAELKEKCRELWAEIAKHDPVEVVRLRGENDDLRAELAAATDRIEHLEHSVAKDNDEICQTLGKVLGAPWYKDDQKNFPGATEVDGVCVGEHVAVTLAEVAAKELAAAQARAEGMRELLDGATLSLTSPSADEHRVSVVFATRLEAEAMLGMLEGQAIAAAKEKP